MGDARTSKQAWLTTRDVETRGLPAALAGDDVTPHFYGGADAQAPDDIAWIIVNKVDGVELWQMGDVAVWRAIRRVAGRVPRSVRRGGGRDPRCRRVSRQRRRRVGGHVDGAPGVAAVRRVYGDPQAAIVVLTRRDAIVAEWATLPVRYIHGELYPSNVLVGPGITPSSDDDRCAAGRLGDDRAGPATLDVAALSGGWAPNSPMRSSSYVGASERSATCTVVDLATSPGDGWVGRRLEPAADTARDSGRRSALGRSRPWVLTSDQDGRWNPGRCERSSSVSSSSNSLIWRSPGTLRRRLERAPRDSPRGTAVRLRPRPRRGR